MLNNLALKKYFLPFKVFFFIFEFNYQYFFFKKNSKSQFNLKFVKKSIVHYCIIVMLVQYII